MAPTATHVRNPAALNVFQRITMGTNSRSWTLQRKASENSCPNIQQNSTRRFLGNREKLRDTIEKRLIKAMTDAEKHKKAVRQKCQTLRKSIDDMETSLLTQIDKMLKEDTKQLDKQLADIKAIEERIRRQLTSCYDVMTNASDVQLLINYHNFPDVTSFVIPNVALPGGVEFNESSWTLPSETEIIGRISRKSCVTPTVDAMRGGSIGDMNQKPSGPLSKRNLSGPEIARMMKRGTRVKKRVIYEMSK